MASAPEDAVAAALAQRVGEDEPHANGPATGQGPCGRPLQLLLPRKCARQGRNVAPASAPPVPCRPGFSRMKYAIVEDQTLVRQMIRSQIPGCAWEGACLADLKDLPEVELLILDLELPDGNALDWLTAQPKHPPVIILTSVKEDVLVHRALKTDAMGLVHKEDPVDVLKAAINAVQHGGVFYSKTFQQFRSRINSDPEAYHKLLTGREQEVLSYLGQGLSSAEVAQIIGLKESTVNDCKSTIMHKIGAKNHPELMRYALAKGFAKI
jgi:DNA-binding NarL/FixJ family response regulator